MTWSFEMAKIKLTKNELKIQKDALKMYNRYLPTLMLKKQQLQTEIRTMDGGTWWAAVHGVARVRRN